MDLNTVRAGAVGHPQIEYRMTANLQQADAEKSRWVVRETPGDG